MSEATPESLAPTFSAPAPVDEPPVATATPDQPDESQAQSEAADDIPAVIKALREDFKAERAKRQAAEKLAEQRIADAKAEIANDFAKVFGLVKDEEQVDPAKLTESLTAEKEKAQKAQVALAVYQNAAATGGDPQRLLTNTTFLEKVKGIDPTNGAAIAEAITEAVEASPWLAATPIAPKKPAPNPAQGGSASGSPTAGDLAAQAAANGDWQQSAALKAQQLMQLGQDQTR